MTASKIAHVNVSIARTAAGKVCRATIEALLDEANAEVLAALWQEVCPYPVDELPERQAMVEDLADFAEVLQPRLVGMQVDELCRLIHRYAVPGRRRPSFVSSLNCGISVRRPAEVTSSLHVPGEVGRDAGAALLPRSAHGSGKAEEAVRAFERKCEVLGAVRAENAVAVSLQDHWRSGCCLPR